MKENTEALIVSSKEIGLEVNADKTKHKIKSLDQNAGRCHNVNFHNRSFEMVKKFNYFGIT